MGTYEWENCPHCSGVFKTGKSEWAKKSPLQKVAYFIRVVWWCIGAAIFGGGAGFIAVLVVMGMIFKASDDQMFSVGLVVAVAVAVLAVAKVLYSSRREIRESLKEIWRA